MAVRAATWDDLELATELLAAQRRAATGVGAVRPEFVRAEWELPSFEVGRDNWVAEEGYASISGDGELKLAVRDPALADELLGRAIARAGERGLATLSLRVVPGDEPLAALVRRHPFELARDVLVMWRPLADDIPAPTHPEGIAVRRFMPADAEAIHDLLDEAYLAWDAHYAPVEHDEWVQLMTGDVEFDPSVWWLAERDGKLVGCALHWSSGWLKDLAVRAPERGRGLGRALVLEGLGEFARRGKPRVGLKVDASNPTGAPALYERLGFVTELREASWSLHL